jgi:ubiquinone/menaquinone biosynthesis C-methylase UbiE
MLSELKRKMQHFYDSAARAYVRRDEGLKQFFHNGSEFIWLQDFDLRGTRILDVGTGTGRLLRYLQGHHDTTALQVGVDLSIEMLRVASERIHFPSTPLLQCDADLLPFPDNSFDLITCFGLLEYVADLRSFLREFFRVIAPTGFLLFTCRNVERLTSFRNGHYPVADHARYSVQSALRECGYRPLRHATIYHLHGRWIWGLTRASKPLGCDLAILKSVMAINSSLQNSARFRYRGKTHLVLAERPLASKAGD